jgi:hypothetical protein
MLRSLNSQLPVSSGEDSSAIVDQPFDDLRARRGRAQSLFAHCLAQFFVLDQLAGAFHRAEQRRFREPRWRLGLRGNHLDVRCLHRLVWQHRREGRRVIGLRFLAIDCEPARVGHHLAFGLERLALHARDAGGDQEFRRRIEHREESFGHQVVKLRLQLAQMLGRD